MKMSQSPEDSLTSASWHSDGKRFVTGGTRGQFYQCVSDMTASTYQSVSDTTASTYQCVSDSSTSV